MCRVVTQFSFYTYRNEYIASYSIFDNMSYPFYFVPGFLIDFALLLMAVTGLFIFAFAFCSLTVTDKRVYGKASFGRRVDLPIDSISSVGTSMFHGIDIGTSSGRISFKAIGNNTKLHEVISKLLIDRQKTKNTETSPSISTGSIVDELKKFKELLDSGIITQEEFDAKKKHETDDFLGSMYAIVEDGEYFSIFVGETDVFVFTDDSFEFVKSDSLYIPVKNEEDTMYYLICNFVKGSNDVEPRSLVKRNGCKEEVLLSFTKKAIVVDALQRCYSLLNL